MSDIAQDHVIRESGAGVLKSRRAQLEAGVLTRPTHPCTKPYITRTHESLVSYAPTSSTCPMLLQATQNVKAHK